MTGFPTHLIHIPYVTRKRYTRPKHALRTLYCLCSSSVLPVQCCSPLQIHREPRPTPTTCRLSSPPVTKPDQSRLCNEASIKKNLAKGDPRLWKWRYHGYAEWCFPTPWQGHSRVQGFQTSHIALYLSVHRHPLKSVLFTSNAVNEQKFSNKHK